MQTPADEKTGSFLQHILQSGSVAMCRESSKKNLEVYRRPCRLAKAGDGPLTCTFDDVQDDF